MSVLMAASAFGVVIWDGEAGDDLWGSNLNWDGNVVPAGTDDVRIRSMSDVLVDSGGLWDALYVGDTGGAGSLSLEGGVFNDAGGSNNLFVGFENAGELTINGGSILATSLRQQNTPSSLVTMNDGQIDIGTAYVGFSGSADSDFVFNGGVANTNFTFVGFYDWTGDPLVSAGGTEGTLTINGGQWNVSDQMHIGRDGGTGHVQVDGGELTIQNLYMGVDFWEPAGDPGVGSMDITNGTVRILDDAIIPRIENYISSGFITGFGGQKMVDVNDVANGFLLELIDAVPDIAIFDGGGDGTSWNDIANWRFNTQGNDVRLPIFGDEVRFADAPDKTTTIGSGVDAQAGIVRVGVPWHGGGTHTLEVNGGTLTTDNTAGQALAIGYAGGTGIMTVNDGVVTVNNVGLGWNGWGTLNMNGGEITGLGGGATGLFRLGVVNTAGRTGTLNMTGGKISCPDFRVQTGEGIINLSGGELNVSGTMYLGFIGGYGTMVLNEGALINSGPAIIGAYDQNTNRTDYQVTMNGGEWNCDQLQIGRDSAVGRVDLYSGVINAGYLAVSIAAWTEIPGEGILNIEGGEVYIDGNFSVALQEMIDEGDIIGYNGASTPQYSYDSVANKTRLYALDPLMANSPVPTDGAQDIEMGTILGWQAGQGAAEHDVYFGTDFDSVNTATTASAGIYQLRQSGTTFDPGALVPGQQYFWRIDEVDGGGSILIQGITWSFIGGSWKGIDDFESYADVTALQAAWGSDPNLALELAVDDQSMSLPGFGSATFNVPVTDWTTDNIAALQILFHGVVDNAASANDMAVTLDDGSSTQTVYYDGRADDIIQAQSNPWMGWNIDLAEFDAVNLASIDTITIAVDDANTVYFDDIRLYIPRCVSAKMGDLNGDCQLDITDLGIVAQNWTSDELNPDEFVWEFNMSVDPVGNGLEVRDSKAGYNMVDRPGQMHITGATTLDPVDILDYNGDITVDFTAEGEDSDGVTLWLDGNPGGAAVRVNMNITVRENEFGTAQVVEIAKGNWAGAVESSIEFAADTLIEVHLEYDAKTQSYQWTATDGVLNDGGTVVVTDPAGGPVPDQQFTVFDNGGIGYIDYLRIAVEEPLQGDTNGDGFVDYMDLSVIGPYWMDTNPVWP